MELEAGAQLNMVASIITNAVQTTLNALQAQSGQESLKVAYGIISAAADSLNHQINDAFKDFKNQGDGQIYSSTDKVMVKGTINFTTRKLSLEVNRVKAQAVDVHVVKASHEASTPLLIFDGRNKIEGSF